MANRPPMMHIGFMTLPAMMMSTTRIMPLANTIAFGGVATGSMNANEAATQTGNAKYNGLMHRRSARDIIIGSRICDVAVLDVNSVKYVISVTLATQSQNGGRSV